MKITKPFIFTVFIFFIFHSSFGLAQTSIKTTFEYSNHKIIIHYEFQGDPTKEYKVSVFLKRTSDPGFNLVPERMKGDYGKGKYADKKDEITWYLTQQEEGSFSHGSDYYFEVTANAIKAGGGLPWYVYVGGAILGGGTAAILLMNNKGTPSSSTSSSTFPKPPGRP